MASSHGSFWISVALSESKPHALTLSLSRWLRCESGRSPSERASEVPWAAGTGPVKGRGYLSGMSEAVEPPDWLPDGWIMEVRKGIKGRVYRVINLSLLHLLNWSFPWSWVDRFCVWSMKELWQDPLDFPDFDNADQPSAMWILFVPFLFWRAMP